MFLVQGAEKTYASFNLTVRNPGGHSSRPRPDNAIYELADSLKKVQAYRFPAMSTCPSEINDLDNAVPISPEPPARRILTERPGLGSAA